MGECSRYTVRGPGYTGKCMRLKRTGLRRGLVRPWYAQWAQCSTIS